jgi:AraC family transcriptional regulator, alkane utilization regulator
MEKSSVFDGARVPHSTVLEVELQGAWCVVVPPSDKSYFYVVRSGSCLLETDDLDSPLRLETGDIVTLVAGQRQIWRDSTETPARPTLESFAQARVSADPHSTKAKAGRTRLLVLSAARSSNQFVSVYPALVAVPKSERVSYSFLHRVVRLIELEHVANRPGREAVLRRLSELVVIELVRFALPRLPRGGRNWLGGLTDRHIGKAISLMHADLGRDWTLSDLADEVGVSRAVFVERFSRLVGEPPNRYLRRVRMHRAAMQLEEDDQAIIKIADSVGYCSESAFNKAFAKEMGITPARYRRTRRGR